MWKALTIALAFVVTLGLPFALRPRQAVEAQTDDTVVIITPHNEALRTELGWGFRRWYKERTGRTVTVDWRVIGGTSEISRFLDGQYDAAFRLFWSEHEGKRWSAEVQAGYKKAKLPKHAPAEVLAAREAFLKSEVGCGMDLFFGGGSLDFVRQSEAGRLVDSGMMVRHPDWFGNTAIPKQFSGERYWDAQGLWLGTVLSNFGILSNTDCLRRLGVSKELRQWSDLADPRLAGEVALADPTKSASIAKAFEIILQQQMQLRWNALRAAQSGAQADTVEAQAVKEGWMAGMQLLQRMGANSRYFTDSAQKPPIDVAQGNAAAGICIDFFGRQQDESLRRRGGVDRIRYVAPAGGTVNTIDPIALFRGAPHREVAVAFIEYALSMEGQKLWDFRPGTRDGPRQYALRRLPVRRDFYEHREFAEYRSDPDENPYGAADQLIYRPGWTGPLFKEMSFVIRTMALDTHDELARAWRAIIAAGMPADALAVMQDLSAVDIEAARGRIKQALSSKDRTEELRLSRELGDHFREQYRRAELLALQHRALAK